MSQTCVEISDSQYYTCYSCPAVAGVQAQAPLFGPVLNLGWNAAARSDALLTGNVYTQFVVQLAAGIACGLAPAPVGVPSQSLLRTASPSEIAHGFLFEVVNGFGFWSPVEYGVRLAAPRPAPPGASWRVQRWRGAITWLMNGVPQLTRPALVLQRLMVVGTLYSSFDVIGTEESA